VKHLPSFYGMVVTPSSHQ